ncbi:D-alanyl-D-alanine carboxypeptidase [Paracoccaceae bacterium]|nr:D-alanyl-D-alanine carboxypeptidase [Paracoccaceae bacterium]
MTKIFIFSTFLLCLWSTVAQGFSTTAKTALVIDNTTGEVLLSKDINRSISPASMSKLMTLWMVFESLDEGKLEMHDTFKVSKKAWKKGGSKMFLREGESVKIKDLINGVIIQSGNDACIVLAEGLAGTEENFAELMNIRAKEIGLTNSNFKNSTGWPDPDHKMSSKDLVTLATKIREKYPSYYKIFNDLEFTWDGISQRNRNPLLSMNLGADGLKTGYTDEAGYGLIASAKQNERRITFVITGLKSIGQRAREAKGITTWAFKKFRLKTYFKKNGVILEAPVWRGEKEQVKISAANGVQLLIANDSKENTKLHVVLKEPLIAPLKKGQKINGHLVVETASLLKENNEKKKLFFPIVVGEDLNRGGIANKVGTNLRTLKSNFFSLFGSNQ